MDMYNTMQRGGMEEGFDAAYDYIVNNPYSSTWMRPDAALLIVFVSDEEEPEAPKAKLYRTCTSYT